MLHCAFLCMFSKRRFPYYRYSISETSRAEGCSEEFGLVQPYLSFYSWTIDFASCVCDTHIQLPEAGGGDQGQQGDQGLLGFSRVLYLLFFCHCI